MPTELPDSELHASASAGCHYQYSLPELVGAMFDSTVLAGDAIRQACGGGYLVSTRRGRTRGAAPCTGQACRVVPVRPLAFKLRNAAERAPGRADARAAAALDVESSTDSDAASGSGSESTVDSRASADSLLMSAGEPRGGCQWQCGGPRAGRAALPVPVVFP
jgi:hypothetical protein